MENNNLEQQLELKRKRLEELRKTSINMSELSKLEQEEKQIINQIKIKQRIAKHPLLFGFSRGYANFWKRLFKGTGVLLKKGKVALEKSDARIAQANSTNKNSSTKKIEWDID